MALFLAATQRNVSLLALNTRLAVPEAADLVRRSGAGAIAVTPGFRRIDYLEKTAEIFAEVPGVVKAVFPLEGRDNPQSPATYGLPILEIDDVPGNVPHEPVTDPTSDQEAILFSTSGTTSAPKLVRHLHGPVCRHGHDVADAFGLSAVDAVSLLALPLCGVFGFSQAIGSLAAGTPIAMLDSFEAGPAMDLLKGRQATHIFGSDDMFRLIMAEAHRPEDFASLKIAGFAAFNDDPEGFAKDARRAGLPATGLYGSSEMHALFAARRPDDPPEIRALAGGMPVSPGAGVRLCDPESGAVLEGGDEGELCFRGPSMFADYLDDPGATQRAKTDDGWFRSGDIGRLEPGGGFRFISRAGDTLRLGGYLVHPAEIESVLTQLPGIDGCQVVAAGAGKDARAIAFATGDRGLIADNEAAILVEAAKSLAKFKQPVRVVWVAAFPTTDGPNGRKVQRAILRETAEKLQKGAVQAEDVNKIFTTYALS